MTSARAARLVLLLGLLGCSRGELGTRVAGDTGTRAAPTASITRVPVVLAEGGRARIKIYAPSRLEEEVSPPLDAQGRKPRGPRLTPLQKRAKADAGQLRASVLDLVDYLKRISGADIELTFRAPSTGDGAIPLVIGELAAQRYGGLTAHTPGHQSYRVVVSPEGIGLFGESDNATGYAIYELLDRLGCRWFMPGELGEVIPSLTRVSVMTADDTSAPSTLYRGIWYADVNFKRRNRLGGVALNAGHTLERWVTEAERDEQPELRAQIDGKPASKRLRWSNPNLPKVIAANISRQLARKPADSVSLSPGDGVDFDDADDRKLDAADWDPSVNSVSLTDRLMVLANRVAAELQPQNPELLLGVLAYANYTRPPVREQLHPSVVPVIAPITYCRVHAWSDDGCPGAKQARQIVEGWSKRADKLAFRGYGYNLAEPAAPFPLMRKWSDDLPYLFAHKVKFFQPETLPNFETSLPGLYLAMRLSWSSSQSPAAILSELFDRFYGHASRQARAYWELLDSAWTDTAEFSGGNLGHARRFTPSFLKAARTALEATKRACQTSDERARVLMLDRSLSQLELYMDLDARFKRGDLGSLSTDLGRWQSEANRLAQLYEPNAAFANAGWAHGSVYANYATRFVEPLYREADRIHRDGQLLFAPFCKARYRVAPTLKLPFAGPPPSLEENDSLTDFCRETWSTLGRYDYFGAMWYELALEPFEAVAGKRVYLFVSKIDGAAELWINGAPIKPVGAAADAPLSAEGHVSFLTYDITAALAPGSLRLTLAVERTRLTELGGGGVLGPIYLYRER